MAYDFDKIARDYDRMNHLMTAGLDRWWRLYGTRAACPRNLRKQDACVPTENKVLDVACGTGDMCLLLAKRGFAVTGVDLSEEMLAIARQKTASSNFQLSTFNFQLGDAEHLPFEDASFDAVTCAFGVRNFVHLEQGLGEMLRVLKPGGRMVILELATPDSAVVRPLYNIYTRRIIPWLGQRLAGSREAYTYLPQSIERFPKGEAFLERLRNSGFKIHDCRHRRLTFGVCRLYVVCKNEEAAG